MSFPTNPNVGINLAQNFPSTPALDSFRKKLHFKHGLGILDNNFRTADFLLEYGVSRTVPVQQYHHVERSDLNVRSSSADLSRAVHRSRL